MAGGMRAWEDGGRLGGARARQHRVGPLPVVPGPGQWFDGRREGGAVLASATSAGSSLPPFSFTSKQFENLREGEMAPSMSGYRGGGSGAVAEGGEALEGMSFCFRERAEGMLAAAA